VFFGGAPEPSFVPAKGQGAGQEIMPHISCLLIDGEALAEYLWMLVAHISKRQY
jgi:hypothetical protein